MTVLNGVSDWLAVVGLVVIAIPILVVGWPALMVAAFLAAVYLFIVKGLPWLADFFKERHSGAVAKKYEAATEDSRRWSR